MQILRSRIPRISYAILLAGLLVAGTLLALGACTRAEEPTPTPPVPAVSPTEAPAQGPGVSARPSPTPESQVVGAPGRPRLAALPVFPAINEPLMVVNTQPADGAEGVTINKDEVRIVVQFNHPVVPLVSIADQAGLPSPITIEPPVQGHGTWLNTSTFVFEPAEDLQPSTQYTVRIPAGLVDIAGAELMSDVVFRFTTAFPAVISTYPENNTIFAGVTQPISVTFNQLMDPASAEQAFTLVPAAGGAPIPGTFRWEGRTMIFVPDQPLAYDTEYIATVEAGAKAATGQATTQDIYAWRFKTAPRPAVRSTSPADGEKSATSIREGFTIFFAAPMDPEKIQVSVQPTITNQFIWWSDEDTVAHVIGGWQASQAYTVTIGAGSLSRYGDPLGQDIVVRFTTAPLDSQFFLNTPGDMGLYDAYQTPRLFATLTNLKQVQFRLYRVPRDDFFALIGEDRWRIWEKYLPAAQYLVREWSVAADPPLNVSWRISTTLTEDPAGRLDPGVYLVYAQADAPANVWGNKHLLVVSKMNLALKYTDSEALVWATDLQSGEPVAGQPVTLYNFDARSLGQGTTDADGVFRATFARRSEPWRTLMAVSEVDGQIVAAVGSDWQSGIGPWEFNIPYNPLRQKYYANIYTDRPLYRPGQTVYFRGILRVDHDGAYSLPDVSSVPITVRDSQGKELLKTDLPLSDFGTFHGEVQLSPAAPLGLYQIELALGPEGPERFFSSQGFRVAAFRKPEFQVEVTTDKAEYVQDETIQVDVVASYFFGGPVAGGKVQWRLLKDDYFFRPAGIRGNWVFNDYDLIERQFYNPQGEVVSEGQVVLDAEGKAHFEVPADVSEYPLSQVFTIDVEVTDINNQAVANRATAIVHKGQFYIGLQPRDYVVQVGEEADIDVLTVDPQANPIANQIVDIAVFQRTWFSVKEKYEDGGFYWTSSYTDTLVSESQVQTDAEGRAVATFVPSTGGVHRVVATARDEAGHEIRSATYVWVSSGEFVNWRQENNDRIELVADKKEYQPGEVAEILIPAPFAESHALLTIERGAIREVQHLFLQGNSETIQIPIQADHTPNIYVSVMLIKGTGPENPLPQFKIGYTNLPVSPREKLLNVTVRPNKTGTYAPRETVTYDLEATDFLGQPVQAEFSLALVDKAILSLATDTAVPLDQAFYGQRMLAVGTAASLTRSAERLNQQLATEQKGGGGGPLEIGTVRRDFRDTAYWNAAVVTDENGRAQVSILLPDNLTTWSLTAKGVTGADTLVGQGTAEIVVTKDVLVRPVTPRFVVVGDHVQLEAVVNNNTTQVVALDVTLQSPHLVLASPATLPLQVPANSKAKVVWQTTVPGGGFLSPTLPDAYGEVSLLIEAQGSGYQDAVEIVLPVYQFSSPEIVATAGQVDQHVTEQIQLPANLDPTRGDLTVELHPSLAAASLDSLKWLTSFPYECSEQTVSKFLPNIATLQALQELGLERPELRANLETQVTIEIQRLYALQHPDGGWGWWLSDQSQAWLTAYALYGLTVANQAGFAVSPEVMDRAAAFLTNYLDRPLDVAAGWDLNQRAFIVYVLSQYDRLPASRAVTLYDRREAMGLYGKAFLALALRNVGGDQTNRIQGLIADFAGTAQLTATGVHWQESETDYWTMNTDTRTTAIILMALAELDPQNANLPGAVRWLMVARQEGHWETTQETAWAILGLTAFMKSTGELQGQYTFTVGLNDEVWYTGQVNQDNVDVPTKLVKPIQDLLLTVANELVIQREGPGRLYYNVNLRYFVPAASLPPLDHGIVIGRQYFKVDPKTLRPTQEIAESAQIGDVLQVRLTIIAPTDLHYLLVEDPLPAGFEAIDTSLRTTSAAAQGPQLEEVLPEGVEVPWWRRAWWSYWTESQLLDHKVALFATFLGRGTYEYTYLIRASVAGDFNVPPAHAEEMYFPDRFGRSAGGLFPVTPAD